VPKVTKAWIAQQDRKGLRKVLALTAYNRRAMLLSIETDRWFQAIEQARPGAAAEREIFWGFFVPYFTLWISMVYVVHEGLVELGIEDAALDKIRSGIDMAVLRRFRNATFHFQPEFRSEKHDELIRKYGFRGGRDLWRRQDFLVRKMARFVRYNPHADEPAFGEAYPASQQST